MPDQSRIDMRLRVESSKLVKPLYHRQPPSTSLRIPLTVFDKITYDMHVAVIYAFHPPAPSNADIERGLAVALSEYREWAGRLERAQEPLLLLNDAGVRFVEASSDVVLDQAAVLLRPSPALLRLHPGIERVDELVQVQLTRFACGTLVVGFTAQHLIADGRATSAFLDAWGLATRGLPISPLPLHSRAALLAPRGPPRVEFEHRGAEFMTRPLFHAKADPLKDDVVVHRAHFGKHFLGKLKAKASLGARGRPYTTFEALLAHLWRVMTRARGLDERTVTECRISVDGRGRLLPPVPEEYFGNLVLWAFPRATAKDLVGRPLQHAAAAIREGIARLDDRYFRSFVDFASSEKVREERLVTTADTDGWVMSPNLEVHSWLRFPFNDVDFGGGNPFCFTPTYSPVEGMLVLLPSVAGDGGIEVYAPVFEHNLAAFKQMCYSIEQEELELSGSRLARSTSG